MNDADTSGPVRHKYVTLFQTATEAKRVIFWGGCGFVKIVSVLGISALVLVPQHSWYTGVCLLYCCHEISLWTTADNKRL